MTEIEDDFLDPGNGQAADTSKDKKLDLSNLDQDFWAETLGCMAEEFSNKIQVLDISKEDLINAEEGQYANPDNLREICCVEYGDWESLKPYIPLEDVNLEMKEHKEFLDQIREECEDCLEGECDCEWLISRTILYCEGQFASSAAYHDK